MFGFWRKAGNRVSVLLALLLCVAGMAITVYIARADRGISRAVADDSERRESQEESPWEESPQAEETEERQSDLSPGTLEIHFLDVGQGDATLIKCNDHALLIDAGDSTNATAVQMYLKKQSVEFLDAVIWTHPDSDHIGGADVITTKYNIGTVYMTDQQADTKAYRDLMDAMEYRNYKQTVPVPGDCFDLGGATVTFLAPIETPYEDTNNNSIVCRIVFGDNTFLFMGDAELEEEEAILNSDVELAADVLKIAHHGSFASTGEYFLAAVHPMYAVISCGKDNPYGFPHAKTLERLSLRDVKVFRTDEQHNIVMTSDGNNITWNTASSEFREAESIVQGAVYIGNMTNRKLHKASCTGLPQLRNQILFDTLEEAEAAGYTAQNQCKICRPFDGADTGFRER